MATIHGIIGVRLTDTEGVITSHQIFVQLDDATTAAQIIAVTQGYCLKLDPITDAAGVEAHFTLVFPSTGLKTGATVKNPLGNGALFTFSQTGSPYKFSVLVQSFAEAKLTGAKVDLTDADIAAYYAWLLAAHTTVQATGKGYQLLSAFLSFQLVTRKHRRAESKVSHETP